jgi:hypothetical protein
MHIGNSHRHGIGAMSVSSARKSVATALATINCVLRESRSEQEEDRMLLPTLLRASGGRAGSFVEIGGFDGVTFSTTIMLERCFGWRGVLIEASSANFAKLRLSPRLATKIHSAVCAGNESSRGTVELTTGGTFGFVNGERETMSDGFRARWLNGRPSSVERVPCQSLTSLLAHVPQATHPAPGGHFTFLSLDVEGAEEKVLDHAQPTAFSLIMVRGCAAALSLSLPASHTPRPAFTGVRPSQAYCARPPPGPT